MRILKQDRFFYMFMIGLIFGLKLFTSKAGADGLDWILLPTARWVEILTGLPFYREPGLGYVNHGLRFIIAESCSGVQYLLILFAALGCSFIYRIKTVKGKLLWLALSFAVSFVYTVFVNGFRISVSISLLNADMGIKWLTPERLHMVEGTVIYLLSLLVIYRAADKITKTFTSGECENSTGSKKIRQAYKCAAPICWYLAITLVLPFLNRAYAGNPGGFTEYAGIILIGCLILAGIIKITNKALTYL